MNKGKIISLTGWRERLALRLEELALLIGISSRSVRREVARGKLAQPVKVGNSIRFKVSDVEEYLERISAERDRPAGGAR